MCDSATGPFVLGIGGTMRSGSFTERALACSLRTAEAAGARVQLLGGEFLGRLPIYDPRAPATHEQQELADAVRHADGLIIGSPSYQGSISGLVKNALDTLELTRLDPTPYLHARAVGVIVTADGSQAAGASLLTVRSIIHALRGWPTPFGAALQSGDVFDPSGACRDEKAAWQLSTVADQVMEFARMRAAAAQVAASAA